ncbi:MAG: hypothetical protein AAF517_25665 [Planctomycetota bacterium]
MDQRRILILGQTKENSYEIRNLLDHRKIELEIALNPDIGKFILSSRKMDLLIIHTESIQKDIAEFFQFLDEEGVEIPVMVLGEEASTMASRLPVDDEVKTFDKPYPVEEMMSYIREM